MARTRQIKPGFFLNTDLAELDPLCRLLFIGLWTIADREGRIKLNPKRIAIEVIPYECGGTTEVVRCIHHLSSTGFLIVYKVGKEDLLQVVNFKKHQHIHKDEKPSELPDISTGEIIKPEEFIEKYRTGAVNPPNNNGKSTEEAPNKNALNPPTTSTYTSNSTYTIPASPDSKILDEENRKEAIKLGVAALVRRYKDSVDDALQLTGMIWNQYLPYNPTPKMFEWILMKKLMTACTGVRHCYAYCRKIGDEKGAHVSEARRFLEVDD